MPNTNDTIELFIGSPLDIESEEVFLKRLIADLQKAHINATIFANFITREPHRQIDFFIATKTNAYHVELKTITAPIFGDTNGRWRIKLENGDYKSLGSQNPYRQALDCKYALSNAMDNLAKNSANVPRSPNSKPFFKHIKSTVCVYPKLKLNSKVPSDFKVSTLGYPEFFRHLVKDKSSINWKKENWHELAMTLGLVRVRDINEITAPTVNSPKLVTFISAINKTIPNNINNTPA